MRTMNLLETYLVVAVGILISIALPILRRYLPKPTVQVMGSPILTVIRPYIIVGIFSMVMAIVVVAFVGDILEQDWRVALITGIGWDSIWQKVVVKGS